MVEEADPLDHGGNDGHFPSHTDHHGSSRGRNFSDVAFWRELVYHTQQQTMQGADSLEGPQKGETCKLQNATGAEKRSQKRKANSR